MVFAARGVRKTIWSGYSLPFPSQPYKSFSKLINLSQGLSPLFNNMYDSSIPFSEEQIFQIVKAGLTIGELRDFYERFPDQDFDTAIGGAVMEKQHKEAGETVPLESDLQQSPAAEPSSEPVSPLISPEISTSDSKLPEEPHSTD